MGGAGLVTWDEGRHRIMRMGYAYGCPRTVGDNDGRPLYKSSAPAEVSTTGGRQGQEPSGLKILSQAADKVKDGR